MDAKVNQDTAETAVLHEVKTLLFLHHREGGVCRYCRSGRDQFAAVLSNWSHDREVAAMKARLKRFGTAREFLKRERLSRFSKNAEVRKLIQKTSPPQALLGIPGCIDALVIKRNSNIVALVQDLEKSIAAPVLHTIDHLLPHSLLGSDHPYNLVYSCYRCNTSKAAYVTPSPLAKLLAEVAELSAKTPLHRFDTSKKRLRQVAHLRFLDRRLNPRPQTAYRLIGQQGMLQKMVDKLDALGIAVVHNGFCFARRSAWDQYFAMLITAMPYWRDTSVADGELGEHDIYIRDWRSGYKHPKCCVTGKGKIPNGVIPGENGLPPDEGIWPRKGAATI